ncbi:hypothetical protein [Streptomyces poonensis]|nr:hypothetical protein [Streptomyces poonensis]
MSNVRLCRSFQATSTGSINDHCSSGRGLGHGFRSLTPPLRQDTVH